MFNKAVPPLSLGYLPNGIYAVEAMLAAASIGAIWSSTSVDFGVNVRTVVQFLFIVSYMLLFICQVHAETCMIHNCS